MTNRPPTSPAGAPTPPAHPITIPDAARLAALHTADPDWTREDDPDGSDWDEAGEILTAAAPHILAAACRALAAQLRTDADTAYRSASTAHTGLSHAAQTVERHADELDGGAQ